MMAMATPVVPGGRDTDPSVLTTQQLQREITMLRELLEARLDGQSAAIGQLKETVNEMPALRYAAVENLEKSVSEKFIGFQALVNEKFAGTETQVDARFRSVGIQFDAMKEAGIKGDAATTKQIDGMSALFYTTTNAQSDKIDDLKRSVNGMAGHSKGIGDGWGWLVGAVVAAGGLVAIFFALSKP